MAHSRCGSPKWNAPLQDETNRRPVGITINDTFTSYVAVLADMNKFATRYTCDWTFAATYNAASPGAATQSYVGHAGGGFGRRDHAHGARGAGE